jgi:hypothetical protein
VRRDPNCPVCGGAEAVEPEPRATAALSRSVGI